LLDDVIHQFRTKISETALDAHALRARIAQTQGDNATALADLRFVAKHDPAAEEDSEVERTIGKLDPSKGISRSDRVSRAMRLARDGQSDKALSEISRAIESASDPNEKADLAFARAMVLYRTRTDYAQAASAFDVVAKRGSPREAEAIFHSAKAWSRADKNELAAQRYRDLLARFPKTDWAERACYNLARLKMLEASWAEAERAYEQYLRKYRKGPNIADARYERAVCSLLAGQKEKARKLLSAQLASSSSSDEVANVTHLLAIAARDELYVSSIEAVAKDFPLSFVSLSARARLGQKGRAAPPPIAPAPSTSPPLQPLALRLPAQVETLRQLGLDRDAEAYLFEHENEVAANYGERALEGLCGAYGTLVHARRRYRVGQRVSVSRMLDTAPSTSTRWVWECLYPQPYSGLVAELEQRHSLPQGLLYAIMRQESAFNPSVRSPAGAVGLMQLMPNTARRISQENSLSFAADDLDSPSVNLELSAAYVGKLLKMMGGNLVLTVAAYNAGPKAVARWFDRAGKLPVDLWVARIPYKETRGYVHRVMGNFARYRYLSNGEESLSAVDLEFPSSISVTDDAY
jgi:soluble lytic murein transglycosylase